MSDLLNRDPTTATSIVQRVEPMQTRMIWMLLGLSLQVVPGMGVIFPHSVMDNQKGERFVRFVQTEFNIC